MPNQKSMHTLCDCCGGFEQCKPYMLGQEEHLSFSEDFTDCLGYVDFEEGLQPLPERPVPKEEKWLCAGCFDPMLEATGVMPACLHCYLSLKPSEYRLQLCSRCNQTVAGVETRSRYNHLRKKYQK